MANDPANVLFLCVGNSARSIMAEAILNKEGHGRFKAFSAGSQPAGAVHPLALDLLGRLGHDTVTFRSKNWDEYAGAAAPAMDYVVTVCDHAAADSCPVWPGHPMTAHWGVADPAAAEGPDHAKRAAFAQAYDTLARRIRAFTELPLDRMEADARRDAFRRIGDLA